MARGRVYRRGSTWTWRIDDPAARSSGVRRQPSRGGYPTREAAQRGLDAAIAAMRSGARSDPRLPTGDRPWAMQPISLAGDHDHSVDAAHAAGDGRRRFGDTPVRDRAVLAVAVELGGRVPDRLIAEMLDVDLPVDSLSRLEVLGHLTWSPETGDVTVVDLEFARGLTAADGPLAPDVHHRLAHRLSVMDADPSIILAHLIRAGSVSRSDRLRDIALRLVERSESSGDTRVVAEAWDLVIADHAGSPAELLRAAEAWHRVGDIRRARELVWRAVADGDPGDPDAVARAAVIAADGADFHREAPAAVALLHRARELLVPLESAESRRRLVEVLSALALLEMTMPVIGPQPPVALDEGHTDVVDAVRWHWVTRPDLAQGSVVEAERLAADLGDPVLQAVTGLVWRASHMAPAHAGQRRARAERARRILVGRPAHARAVHAALLDALEVGDMAAVRIALGELAGLASTSGDPSVQWRYGYTASMLTAIAGDMTSAEEMSEAASHVGLLAGEATAVIVRLEQRTMLSLERLDDVATVIALGTRLDSVSHPPLLAGVLHLLGELQRIKVPGVSVDRRVLAELVAHLETRESLEQNRAITLAFVASAVTAIGDGELAERLLEHTDEVRDRVARESSGIICLGHHDLFTGMLLLAADDRSAGIEVLQAACIRNREAGFVRAQLAGELALLDARRDQMNDDELRRRASELARQAEERGLHLVSNRARRMGASSHSIDFSDRQLVVLQGLADGATYQQIADRIGFSHGTVRAEVTTIYDRLGADSRSDAVHEAEWRGLIAPSRK